MSKIYAGDHGTTISVNCAADVLAATSLAILAMRPDGTSVTWAGAPGVPTSILYTTQPGDLNMAGIWTLQAVYVNANGSWHGEAANLTVYALGD